MARFVSELFCDDPYDDLFSRELNWHLRGDPEFWAYLRKRFSTVELPYPPERLERDIREIFQALTGEPLNPEGDYYVPEFRLSGGMSNGVVSGCFWLEAIPYLTRRLERINGELAAG